MNLVGEGNLSERADFRDPEDEGKSARSEGETQLYGSCQNRRSGTKEVVELLAAPPGRRNLARGLGRKARRPGEPGLPQNKTAP